MTDARRKAIPTRVKLEVVLAQSARCTGCGERLGPLSGLQFDHRPALWERAWDETAGDTIPPANSVEHIEATHIACHAVRTHGTAATSAGSDANRRAKVKRIGPEVDEFTRRMLAKTGQAEAPPPKRSKWPSRPFRRRKA